MAGKKPMTSYAELIAEAEAAVVAVKDPELRRVAFEKILATLLDNGPPSSVQKKTQKGISPQSKSKSARPTAGKGPKKYIEELLADGFFGKKQRTIADVKAELANRGHHVALTGLSGPLQALTQQRKLRRQKITAGDGGRTTYAYSVW
jgi:hypothetical protein